MLIAALAGSLRRGSYNRAFLESLPALAPEGMTLERLDLHGIPVFNEDDEANDPPEAVTRLREAVKRADGLLIATPEYNGGIPGGLKNALDWLSRPSGQSVFPGKPTALAGASPGPFGTVRAQGQARASLEHMGAPVMPAPLVLIAHAKDKFDEQGRLTDERTRAIVTKFLASFADWVTRNGRR
jgi:chromate reductase, NAD(P)H dehydrogenase (quinone)